MSLRYLDKGETESYEVNSFPSGQTHVGFTNLYLRGIAATVEKSSQGNCLRIASVKLKGRQYYSLTALISVLRPEIQGVYNHAFARLPEVTPNSKTRRVSLRTG